MTVLNFPPTAGQPTDGSFIYEENGVTYIWDGVKWKALVGDVAFWSRANNTLSPVSAGDNVDIGTGDLSASDATFSGLINADGYKQRFNSADATFGLGIADSTGSNFSYFHVEKDDGTFPYLFELDGDAKFANGNITLNADGGAFFAEKVSIKATALGNADTFQVADGFGVQKPNGQSFPINNDACVFVGSMNNTRSLNASGSVNTNGSDYAEYMYKAGDFVIEKGEIAGITSSGKLTNKFADSISYIVKSTEPSFVGGDSWADSNVLGIQPLKSDKAAYDLWHQKFEQLRKTVDRVAFAGQVPVNVVGATPGQYIVPVQTADGSIEGVAKNESELTLSEYVRSVGKVIAIENDGRARIIVKVA